MKRLLLVLTLAVLLVFAVVNTGKVVFAQEISLISFTSSVQNELSVPVYTNMSVTFDMNMNEPSLGDE